MRVSLGVPVGSRQSVKQNARRGSKAAITALTAILAASVALVLAPPASARPEALPSSLSTCTNPTNAFVSLEIAPQVTSASPIGAGYHRLWDMGVAWRDLNPAPGVFTWTVLDQRVAQAEASGSIPMLVMGLTPQWAAADPSAGDPRWGSGTASPPADMNTYRSFVDAVVSRYGTRIGAYEVWNEANLTTFWTGTSEQMAAMTKIAYDTIKAKNPGAVVTSASVTTRLRSPMERFVTPYVKALASAGSPIDAFAIHTYPAGDAGPPQRVADIQNWQSVVSNAAGSGSPLLSKQVWDTEVNYGLAGPGATPATDYSDAQGAALITQTFADSLELGIDATFWYLLTASPFDLLGVQLWSGTPESFAAWNAARAKYSAGADLCAAAPAPTPTPTPTPTTPADDAPSSGSVVIDGARAGKLTVVITGSAPAGSAYSVHIKVGKKGQYKEAGTGLTGADGSFRFVYKLKSGRAVKAYVETGSLRSNVVTVPASRAGPK